MSPANDNARQASTRQPLFATTLRLLSSLDAMPEPAPEPRRAERS